MAEKTNCEKLCDANSPTSSGTAETASPHTTEAFEDAGPPTKSHHSNERTSGIPDEICKDAQKDEEEGRLAESTTPPPYTVFSSRTKLFIMIMAAWAACFSPLSGNIYYPALNVLARDFDVSSSRINLTLTMYMITQALAPAFVGDLADVYGRRPAYFLGLTLFIAANIGIALVDDFAGLLVLRCLQSAGSSGLIALASGVAADISTSGERGRYMGWTLSGAMVGPAIGPVLGGLLAEYLGWRSIFWFLTILACSFLVVCAVAFPETCRNVVGNGSIPPRSWNKTLLNFIVMRRSERRTTHHRTSPPNEETAMDRKGHIPNPLKVLHILRRPEAAMLLAFNSINFAAFYDISASLPYLLREIYHLDELQIGLCFLPFGLGCFMAPFFNGPLLDWQFRRVARRAGFPVDTSGGTKLHDFPIERARLPVAWPMSTTAALTLMCYGWVMEVETHLAVPLVLLYIMGACFVASANVCSTMIVDYHPEAPSTATAANNLCRCLLSAGATAVIIDMIQGMGRGWCFTFIGLVIIAASPLILLLARYGPGWREKGPSHE